MAATNANAINYFSPAKWVVSKTAGEGTHTTIAGALAVASSGDTIVVIASSTAYTENNTVGMNINIVGMTGDGYGQVNVTGKFTVTGAYTVNISNIYMQTNSDYVLAVTGSAASIVNLTNCYLNCSNNTGIDYTSSSASSAINLYQCTGNLGTTGIGYYTMSSAGSLGFISCNALANSGNSTTASSNSAGTVYFEYSVMEAAVSTSSSGVLSNYFSIFNTAGINTACITLAGTGTSNCQLCSFASGTASAISIGTGTTLYLTNAHINSTNTDSITGAGSLAFTGLSFQEGSTYLVNTTTQAGGTIQGIRAGNAPSAGYIGERISSYNSSGTSLTTNTITNIASISLTAGVWDISLSGLGFSSASVATEMIIGISTANNSIPDQGGDSGTKWQGTITTLISLAVPAYRVTLSSTTPYYYNALLLFASGSGTAYGRISATRVG